MTRPQGTKKRLWAEGGEKIGQKYDSLGRPSDVFDPWYYSSESIMGSNNPGPPYHSGGPMLLFRDKLTHTLSAEYLGSVATSTQGLKDAYVGRFRPGYVPNAIPVPTVNLDALGTEGVSRTIPTSPSASLSVFVGELKDFPGMITQTKKFFFDLARGGIKLTRGKSTVGDALRHFADPGARAGDYLNLQFGWVPFLRDLQAFYKTGRDIQERVAFIRRNNMGKPVKRSRTLRRIDESIVAQATVNDSVTPVMQPYVHTFLYGTGSACSQHTRTIRTKGRAWFKATYMYYSPEIEYMPDWVLAADALGLRLDPAVIYELTPWSWLLDWFTTVGPVINNAVEFARHHVVMHHGYAMWSCSTEHTSIANQKMRTGYGAKSSSPTVQLETRAVRLFETKQRVVANPFGFGVNWESLSNYQLSILAALGITRARTGM